MIVFSPSNMDTFRKCPRRFQGQSITKDIKYKPSAKKDNGIAVHSELEKLVNAEKLPEVFKLPDTVDMGYVRQRLMGFHRMRNHGMEVFTEHELAINNKYQKAGWWDDDCILRAKADLLLVGFGGAVIVDWKTGRKWDTDAFQLRVESLLVHLLYGIQKVNIEYDYVEQGETVYDVIDFTSGIGHVQDIVELMKTMRESISANVFPATPNKFCKWCDYYKTEKCNVC